MELKKNFCNTSLCNLSDYRVWVSNIFVRCTSIYFNYISVDYDIINIAKQYTWLQNSLNFATDLIYCRSHLPIIIIDGPFSRSIQGIVVGMLGCTHLP